MGSVIGDRVTITTAASLPSGFPALVELGPNVRVGAGSTLRSCLVMEGASIGENCVVSEGALVEAGASVGAGSVVPPGRLIPAGQLWAGNPAAFVGPADGLALEAALSDAHELKALHMAEYLPDQGAPHANIV